MRSNIVMYMASRDQWLKIIIYLHSETTNINSFQSLPENVLCTKKVVLITFRIIPFGPYLH